MTDNHVRLSRANKRSLHDYEAQVRIRGGMGEPFTITVVDRWDAFLRQHIWVVETDDTRAFSTLKRARQYIDTFFEEAR